MIVVYQSGFLVGGRATGINNIEHLIIIYHHVQSGFRYSPGQVQSADFLDVEEGAGEFQLDI